MTRGLFLLATRSLLWQIMKITWEDQTQGFVQTENIYVVQPWCSPFLRYLLRQAVGSRETKVTSCPWKWTDLSSENQQSIDVNITRGQLYLFFIIEVCKVKFFSSSKFVILLESWVKSKSIKLCLIFCLLNLCSIYHLWTVLMQMMTNLVNCHPSIYMVWTFSIPWYFMIERELLQSILINHWTTAGEFHWRLTWEVGTCRCHKTNFLIARVHK